MTFLSQLNPFGPARPNPNRDLVKQVFGKMQANPIDADIQKLIQQQNLLEGPGVSPPIARPVIEILPKPPAPVIPPTPPVIPPAVMPSLPPAVSPSPFLQLPPLVTSALNFPKLILPLIPPILKRLVTPQKVLQHINIEITASQKQKIYEIGFGKNHELSTSLEVVAGKEIRLLYNIEAAKNIKNYTPSIFSSFSLLSYIPVVNRFVYKRQQIETNCNIIINDPGNPLLRKGPILKYSHIKGPLGFSKELSFNIIHIDPLIKNTSNSPLIRESQSSDDVRIKCAHVKLTDPVTGGKGQRTQVFPLPFDPDPKKACDYHLRITQYQ